MIKYVVGFMFNEDKTKVALIRKSKPEWQKDLLNGIGGKVEEGESHRDAMVREFEEETGKKTHNTFWVHFGTMLCTCDFEVELYTMIGSTYGLENKENNGEKIEITNLSTITPLRKDMVENLCWLISLALDSIMDGRPMFTHITYPD